MTKRYLKSVNRENAPKKKTEKKEEFNEVRDCDNSIAGEKFKWGHIGWTITSFAWRSMKPQI